MLNSKAANIIHFTKYIKFHEGKELSKQLSRPAKLEDYRPDDRSSPAPGARPAVIQQEERGNHLHTFGNARKSAFLFPFYSSIVKPPATQFRGTNVPTAHTDSNAAGPPRNRVWTCRCARRHGLSEGQCTNHSEQHTAQTRGAPNSHHGSRCSRLTNSVALSVPM